jgi:hypothetical protein
MKRKKRLSKAIGMTTKNKEGTRRRNMRSTTLYLGSFFDESLPGREKQHRHRKSTRTKMIRTKVSVRFMVRILS